MSKKIEKLFKSYRDQLLHLAKLYGVVEVKSYARSSKKLTISQLELLLIKNHIKLPTNRSSDKAIAKQELKQNTITNIYLSVFHSISIYILVFSYNSNYTISTLFNIFVKIQRSSCPVVFIYTFC